MKILIIYKTRHNTTKNYAKWISEEIQSDIINVDKVKSNQIKDYDIIVFGSWIYDDKITIAPFIKDNWEILKNKKLLLFCNGLTNSEDPKMNKIFETKSQ